MRITAEEKAATRKRILDTAKSLFRTKGFEQATTRDIAREVGIATGTMFNYFGTKEAIVVELATQLLDKAQREFTRTRRSGSSLEEDLFGRVAGQLRHLRPLRKYIRPLLDTALSPATISPVTSPGSDDTAATLRADLTEQFVNIFSDHGVEEPSSVAVSIFWALYVGVFTFWSSDKSPQQEDSLALLDQSLHMYVEWLS